MTVSCNDDDVSPVLEERVLVKEINLEVTSELPLLKMCIRDRIMSGKDTLSNSYSTDSTYSVCKVNVDGCLLYTSRCV